MPQDPERALHYFMQAADAGNPIAMAFLGKVRLSLTSHKSINRSLVVAIQRKLL